MNKKTKNPPPPAVAASALRVPHSALKDRLGHSFSLRLELIDPSPFNPRDNALMDSPDVIELSHSIAEQGIVNPLTVRPAAEVVAGQLGRGERYELIAGERRYLAAARLQLAEVPVRSGDFTDAEAREIQAVENLQRANLNLLQEAAGYQAMLDLEATGRDALPRVPDISPSVSELKTENLKLKTAPPKIYPTIAALSARLAIPETTIYGRLKLLRAPDLARRAYSAKALDASVLLLLARIPDPKAAERATWDVLDRYKQCKDEKALLHPDTERMSYRAAKAHIQQKYMIRLKGAPFDPEDATLIPAAGKCSACPHRTGNLQKLIPDIRDGLDQNRYGGTEKSANTADVCTHPSCFAAKKAADFKQRADKVAAKGDKLLPDGSGDRLFDRYNDGHPLISDKYIDLRAPFPGLHHKKNGVTWEEALGNHIPTISQTRDPKNRIRLLLPVADAIAAAELAGFKTENLKLKTENPAASRQAEQASREARIALLKPIAQAAAKQVLDKVCTTKIPLGFWQYLVKRFAGGKIPNDPTACVLRLVEHFVDHPVTWDGEMSTDFQGICAAYGVDLKALVKAAKKDAK